METIRTIIISISTILCFGSLSFSQTTIILDTPGAGSWTVPCGVTSISVSLYGGGGGGGGANSNGQAGGGGGAGGFVEWTFAVVPSSTINYNVGAGGAGGNPAGNGATGSQTQWFFSPPAALFALGGTGGFAENNGGGGGTGGIASAWANDITGENGFAGGSNNGGSGGRNFGPDGGIGGAGGTPGQDGQNGLMYGGGAGGGGDKWWGINTDGGDGSDGAIVIVFTSTVTFPDAGADVNICVGPISLSGNTPDVGWTGTWSVISGPASVTTPTSPTSGVTGMVAGDCSTFRWSFTFGGCPTTTDDVTICIPIVCNDDCGNADPLIVNGPCVSGDNSTATVDAGVSPSCFSGSDHSHSVWYTFVATDDSITVNATAGTLTSFSMAVYADCPALTEVGCVDNSPILELTGLTVSNTYYVLLDGNGTNTGDFCIAVSETEPAIGTCERPRRLYVNTDCTKSSSCSGTNENNYIQGNTSDQGAIWVATSPGDFSCPMDDTGQSAYWVSFNSESNTSVDFRNNGGAGNGLDYSLFTGTCASYTEVACYSLASNGTVSVPVIANTEYLVLITPPWANTPPRAYLCITSPVVETPPNDDCGSATPITSGFNFEVTNSNATVDLDNTLCAGTTENNVWVVWTAEFSGPAFVNLQNQDCVESNGMQLSIYEADVSCPTAFSNCELYISPNSDDNFYGQFTAVMGSTYYMQLDGYCGTGCTFDFCITEQGGANCSTLSSLPVELVSFEGINQGDNNLLQWITASEIDNDYFTIERSINGFDWDVAGYVNGSGTITQLRRYEFVDDNPYAQVTYYRLSQTDYNGTLVRHKVISVNGINSLEGDLVSTVFPNPAESYITFAFNGHDTETTLSVRVIDELGAIVIDELYNSLHVGMAATIMTDALAGGTYRVVFIQGNNRDVQKLVILH